MNVTKFQSTGFIYTMSNCLYSSLIDEIETYCHCSPIFAVKPDQGHGNTTWCIGPGLQCQEAKMLHWGDGLFGLDKAYNNINGVKEKCMQVTNNSGV